MINGMYVVDATTHAYNLADSNLLRAGGPTAADSTSTRAGGPPSRYAIVFREVLWGLHAKCTPPDARATREMFLTDWSPDTLAWTLFTESDVDFAVHHRLRLDSLFADGLIAQEKNEALAARYPQRFMTYAGVNPMDGVEAAMRDLRQQVERLPGTIGMKLYPDAGTPDRSWRMDDPQYTDLWDLAVELGLKVVAVHKVVPNGLTPLDPYRIDDLERTALHYPQLSFEIVHAGMPPFVDEATMAITRLPNVYANLEITSAFLERRFGLALEALAQFVGFAGPEKILYASGGMHFHPQPIIDFLANVEFPQHLLDRYRIEQLTHEQRAGILGGNYARMAGLDLAAIAARQAGDEFDTWRAEHGKAQPWTHWRQATAGPVETPAARPADTREPVTA